jgi:hypothetical protein
MGFSGKGELQEGSRISICRSWPGMLCSRQIKFVECGCPRCRPLGIKPQVHPPSPPLDIEMKDDLCSGSRIMATYLHRASDCKSRDWLVTLF